MYNLLRIALHKVLTLGIGILKAGTVDEVSHKSRSKVTLYYT
jgi:hypothetical protein